GVWGLVVGTASAITVFVMSKTGVFTLPGQGTSFLAAIVAFVVDIAVSVAVTYVTKPKPEAELAGLVYSLTAKESRQHAATGEDAGWYRKPVLLAGIALALTIVLNIAF
ncbi:Na+/galactose cotransporter, partial [Amycolatopsis rhizosphaerae]